MSRSLENPDLAGLLEPLQGLVDASYLVHRDHLVALAEEAKNWALEAVRKIDRRCRRVRADASAVEGDGHLDGRSVATGGQKCDRAAHTEPGHAEAVPSHLRPVLEVMDDHAHLGHERRPVELLDVANGARHVL